ncbi:PREDICTED: protein CutA homolog [Condylura cristata]|uniref:protein CutA homolog n=1 Tax=Condylura cristata TaxID=143302 RepID=UPI00064320E1|nr:PREDICTED: protein CutA homolog [Condylura cristata]
METELTLWMEDLTIRAGSDAKTICHQTKATQQTLRISYRVLCYCAKLGDIISGDSGSKILAASLLTYPILRTLYLHLHSAVTGSYVSGTYSVVFVNCPNEQIARDIARAVLDKKLATSVNILPRVSSLYFWNGEIEEATEILLLIKTKTSRVYTLSSYIRLVHPFEIPEVFSLLMDQGDVHYLKWLEEGMGEY